MDSCAQARRGALRGELRAPLLPLLLGPSSGGALALLVRHALDDEHAGTHCAAIDVLHAVLVCERDEVRIAAPRGPLSSRPYPPSPSGPFPVRSVPPTSFEDL